MKSLQGTLKTYISLKKHTSWKVGGIAKSCYQPTQEDDLAYFLSSLPVSEPLLWLGLGSNVLMPDAGFEGTVILMHGTFKNIILLDDAKIYVEAGVPCPVLARFCTARGLQGLEFLSCIPGTLGGAIAMNAGAYGSETWNYIINIKTITRNGQIIVRTPKDYHVRYRSVITPVQEWFLGVTLQLKQGNTEASLNRIREVLNHRRLTQPSQPSAGSIFKNPEGTYAGLLIEHCGLKGKRIGSAVVSHKHANFIVNEGNASSAHIIELICLLSETVLKKTGILLIPEIRIYSSQGKIVSV